MMGDGAVVLPKAVDEIVGKRRDRRNRLRSARNHRGHGIGRQGERLAFIDEERFVRRLAARALPASGAAKVQTSSNGEWFFFIDQARLQVVRLRENLERTRETKIAVINACLPAGLYRALALRCITAKSGIPGSCP